jgi:hypothetical protein
MSGSQTGIERASFVTEAPIAASQAPQAIHKKKSKKSRKSGHKQLTRPDDIDGQGQSRHILPPAPAKNN